MHSRIALSPIHTPAQQQVTEDPPWRGSGLAGKIDSYVSKMDGQTRGYGICTTGDSSALKPLVVVVTPGAPTDAGQNEILQAEQYAWYAKKNGKECVVLRSTGRGPGSVYQNYGELDVLEGIEDVIAKYPIDRDRVSVTGFSMGGAATWYLISHYPDLFAAGAPMAGYCDYRLWEKPGGLTFPMQPWEEPSWQARSAAFLGDNFEHTPLWIVHGELDRAISMGVPVEHSREMYRSLKARNFDVRYTEVPKTGHTAPQDVYEEVVNWLIQQKKERRPKHVSLTTYELRHNRNYWVTIDQMERSGRRASIEATQAGEDLLVVTENVSAFTLGPFDGAEAKSVRIDGHPLSAGDWSQAQLFRRPGDGQWTKDGGNLVAEKHHGQSGPIPDIFFDDVILVPGTSGNAAETFFNLGMAGHVKSLFKTDNGGLHRGGVRGVNTIDLVSANDTELSEEDTQNNNLLLFGTERSNTILKRYIDKLPVTFGSEEIHLGGKTYTGSDVAVFAIFPHPGNPNRYVAVMGGITPDAIVWGSHLSYLLLPDYMVFDRGKMLDWGFWDNAWERPGPW